MCIHLLITLPETEFIILKNCIFDHLSLHTFTFDFTYRIGEKISQKMHKFLCEWIAGKLTDRIRYGVVEEKRKKEKNRIKKRF